MTDQITVWYQGNAMTVYVPVAESFGLHDGQVLTQGQFPPVLEANCQHGIIISLQGIYENGGPDPSIRRE